MAKDVPKATCIEALEWRTKLTPEWLLTDTLLFVLTSLPGPAPRIKMESGRVVANVIHLHPDLVEKAIANLLPNTADEGTTVRWSAAMALGAIVKMKTEFNETLLPALRVISDSEEKNSIKKIYTDSFKKAGIK